jgi:uncharacterized protein YbjT (DUF2867 family)
VPPTILRATQFHELPAQMLKQLSFGPIVVAPKMRLQTVAAREVAQSVVDAALGAPRGRVPEIAGPEVNELPDLITKLIRARRARRLVVPVRVPGHVGHAIANGELLLGRDGLRGTQTFDEWLASEDAREWL